mmetsp:Transcript_19580/g.41027  ORF Transcript_19580/g.41027 Transcript_19580/m.41027 type:complete len:238 (-) Transcript_19580:1944-2657(-)
MAYSRLSITFVQRKTVPNPPFPRGEKSLNSELYLEYRRRGIPSMLSIFGVDGCDTVFSSGILIGNVLDLGIVDGLALVLCTDGVGDSAAVVAGIIEESSPECSWRESDPPSFSETKGLGTPTLRGCWTGMADKLKLRKYGLFNLSTDMASFHQGSPDVENAGGSIIPLEFDRDLTTPSSLLLDADAGARRGVFSHLRFCRRKAKRAKMTTANTDPTIAETIGHVRKRPCSVLCDGGR